MYQLTISVRVINWQDWLSELTVCVIYRPLFNGNNSLYINFFKKRFSIHDREYSQSLLSVSHLIILVKRSCWKECLCMKINTFNKVLNRHTLTKFFNRVENPPEMLKHLHWKLCNWTPTTLKPLRTVLLLIYRRWRSS